MKTSTLTQYAAELETTEDWDIVPHCTQSTAEEVDPSGAMREAGLLIADM